MAVHRSISARDCVDVASPSSHPMLSAAGSGFGRDDASHSFTFDPIEIAVKLVGIAVQLQCRVLCEQVLHASGRDLRRPAYW